MGVCNLVLEGVGSHQVGKCAMFWEEAMVQTEPPGFFPSQLYLHSLVSAIPIPSPHVTAWSDVVYPSS